MDEAVVEHAGAKQLIAQLQGADPGDELYDARVTVLGEQIDHHVEEEEGSMFPKARFAGIDTLELGAAMLARKAELLNGAPPREAATDAGEEEEDETPPKTRIKPVKRSAKSKSAAKAAPKKKRR
jgi:hypothetical protein